MVISCCAIDCTNRQGKSGVSFHRFPSDPKRRTKWIAACRRKDWIPGPHDRLCSKHFVSSKNNNPRSGDFVPTVFTFSPSPIKRRKHDNIQNIIKELEHVEDVKIQNIERKPETTMLQNDVKKIQDCDLTDELVTKILLMESEALRIEIAKLDFLTAGDLGKNMTEVKEGQ